VEKARGSTPPRAQYAATGCLNTTFYATADEQLAKVRELCADQRVYFFTLSFSLHPLSFQWPGAPRVLSCLVAGSSPKIRQQTPDRQTAAPSPARLRCRKNARPNASRRWTQLVVGCNAMKYFFQVFAPDSGERCLLILKDKGENTKGTWKKSTKPQDGSLKIGATQGSWIYRYESQTVVFYKSEMKSPVAIFVDVPEFLFYGVLEDLSNFEGTGSILLPNSFTEKTRIVWRLVDITAR
jgi:hypothetical protein